MSKNSKINFEWLGIGYQDTDGYREICSLGPHQLELKELTWDTDGVILEVFVNFWDEYTYKYIPTRHQETFRSTEQAKNHLEQWYELHMGVDNTLLRDNND